MYILSLFFVQQIKGIIFANIWFGMKKKIKVTMTTVSVAINQLYYNNNNM